MDIVELNEIVRGGESQTVEFKKNTGQLREGLRTACAMLNGKGGFVLFGVTDKGFIGGQHVATKTLEDVHNDLRNLDPPAFPDVEIVRLTDGKSVIVLSVPGGGGLYEYEGRAYLRNGPTTIRMPRSIRERKLLERSHPLARWENQPAAGVTFDVLDRAEILRTVEEAIRRGRMDDPGTRNVPDLLSGLQLTRDGQILNAAVVLFGEIDWMVPIFPQCLLKMARFRGIDKSEFIDNRQEYGNAFDLLIRGQRFLRDHLPIAGRVVPGLFERQDDPLYPPEALREALANALCHRDYAAGGGSISIGIYDDRLEIGSVGPLPFGQTPDELKKPHPSRPWNPLIAGVFHRRGIIESWGRGTLKMAELTHRAGLAPPEIEAGTDEVIVRFWPTGYVPPLRVGLDLSDLQRQILQVLAALGPSLLPNIMDRLPAVVPRRTVQDNLKILRTLDLVQSSGTNRWTHWSVS